MPIRSWEAVPNIRSYHGRLCRQIFSDMFSYYWGQVLSGAVLAPIAALVSQHYGWIPRSGIWWTIGVSLIPYLFILMVSLVVNIIRAPVKLDNERATENARLSKENTRLQVKPYNATLEADVRQRLQRTTASQRAVLRHLLMHGKQELRTILREVPVATNESVIELDAIGLVNRERNGTTLKRSEYFEVKGNFLPILQDILFESD